MHTEPITSQPKRVALVPRRPKRNTALARRRRLNHLIRQVAADMGLDIRRVSVAERTVLHQLGALLLQVEVSTDALVDGATPDADTTIRLTSEARRLLSILHDRVEDEVSPPLWSPLRARIHKAPASAEPEEALP
jgi:hypothetical protein